MLVVLLGFLAHYLYFVVVDGVFQLATAGKRTVRLAVLSPDGRSAYSARLILGMW